MVDDTKVEETGDDLLARAHESRGFHLGVHEIMHGADQEYMQHYQRWLEFANIKERHLDKKTKQRFVDAVIHNKRENVKTYQRLTN